MLISYSACMRGDVRMKSAVARSHASRIFQATPSRSNGGTFDAHALELQPPAAGLSDSRRQQWFFESYPNAFDQSAPLFGNAVRIWNRETRSVICFDPP